LPEPPPPPSRIAKFVKCPVVPQSRFDELEDGVEGSERHTSYSGNRDWRHHVFIQQASKREAAFIPHIAN